MTDSVKFIFKTLIKVPIFIFVAFFIFNIFAFCFIYFRLLGFSYVVMQTAVENNYLPYQETVTLVDYLRDTAQISMVEKTGIVIGDSSSANFSAASGKGYIREYDSDKYAIIPIDGDADTSDEGAILNFYKGNPVGATKRQQYGGNVVCGVYCIYRIIWPLDYRYTGNRDAIVNSSSGDYTYDDVGGRDGASTKGRDSYIDAFSDLDIFITYKVPGLKYYPDLSVY